ARCVASLLQPRQKAAFPADPLPRPVFTQRLRYGMRHAQRGAQDPMGGTLGITVMVEHHHNPKQPLARGDPEGRKAAPAAAIAGERNITDAGMLEAKTIGGPCAVAEFVRYGDPLIEALRVVAGRVDPAFIGEYVVERGGNARIAAPVDAVFRRQ